jgi:hypothetical protein
MTWFTQSEQTCPKAKNRDGSVIEGEKATGARLGLLRPIVSVQESRSTCPRVSKRSSE